MLIGPQKDSSTDRVFQGLRGDIVRGALPGGTRLVERELADRFGVSRLPVREAIRWLILEGLIDRSPRHGGIVHTMSYADAADIGELHSAFDELAAALAVTRRTDEHVAAFRAALHGTREALAAGDEAATCAGLQAMREVTFAATRNRPLAEVHQALEGRTLRVLMLAIRAGVNPLPHFADLESALVAHDAAAATRAMRGLEDELAAVRRRAALAALDDSGDDAQRLDPLDGCNAAMREAYTPGFVTVRDAVREQIASGERRPGSVISGRLLAVEFDVSRYPALEAIEALAYEGLVQLGSARVASRVRGVSAGEAADLFDVATTLDGVAVSIAARGPRPEELEKLHDLLERERAAFASDPATAQCASFAFVRELYAVSGNRLVAEMGRKLEGRRRLVLSASPVTARIVRAHEQLYRAIAARDGELAAEIVRRALADPAYRAEVLAAAEPYVS